MVPVGLAALVSRRDRLLQSVDFAIGKLLETTDDPLALASHLWVLRRHKITLANGADLASWVNSWVREILVEGRVGTRRDEALTSAVLAAASLVRTPYLLPPLDCIRQSVSATLAREFDCLDHGEILFNRRSYAAMLLLAAQTLEVQHESFPAAARATASAFVDALPDGGLLGLTFIVQLLPVIGDNTTRTALCQGMLSAIDNPALEYEDQVYLAQALWSLHHKDTPPAPVENLIQQVIDRSHLVPDSTASRGEGPCIDYRQVSMPYSDLALAALLDLVLSYQTAFQQREEARVDRRYRGRRWITISAFGFYTVVLLGFWVVVAWSMLPWANDAWRFWVLHDYGSVGNSRALLLLASLMLIPYLALVTAVIIWTLFSMLVLRPVESDRRMYELLLRRVIRISVWWWIAEAGLTVTLGVFTNILSPAFEHIFDGS